MTDKENK